MGTILGSPPRRRLLGVVVVLATMWLPAAATGSPSSPPRAPVAVTRTGGACAESAYATHGTRQFHPFTWLLNVSSVPAYLDRAGAVRAIVRATTTMDRARTPCLAGRALAPVLPPAIYDGPTRRSANITPDAECFLPSNSDGINVVSFGPLPYDVIAVTCTYSDARRDIWQSDIMLNQRPGLFTLHPGGSRCVGSYDLQAVATHERGHSFGLAHVPDSRGSEDLTMSTILPSCDASARTLGWGDVLGLSRIYRRGG